VRYRNRSLERFFLLTLSLSIGSFFVFNRNFNEGIKASKFVNNIPFILLVLLFVLFLGLFAKQQRSLTLSLLIAITLIWLGVFTLDVFYSFIGARVALAGGVILEIAALTVYFLT